MFKKLQKLFLILSLILIVGCSTATDSNWQPLGWEENIPSIEPKFEKPFEPVFLYDPLTNNIKK